MKKKCQFLNAKRNIHCEAPVNHQGPHVCRISDVADHIYVWHAKDENPSTIQFQSAEAVHAQFE